VTGAFLELDNLTKQWSHTFGVRDLTLNVAQGSILALLGPSGSGKTTALRLIAGFEQADSGRVVIDGEDVTSLPPARRRIGMVFQHYALFPHLNVGENVAFGLVAQGRKKAAAARVAECLSLVELAGFESRRVDALSGGQQQRVALARALAPEPRVLLLDEPLSNLDPALRERTRREVKRLVHRIGMTTVFVTHEQEEAFELGDQIAVLKDGRLEQVGNGDELYERPRTEFVATFIGGANVFFGTVIRPDAVRVAGFEWPAILQGDVPVGKPVRVLVRPEALKFADQGLPGVVSARRFVGPYAAYVVEGEGGDVWEVRAAPKAAAVGAKVRVVADRAMVFA
jgi:ABC-type Fe3+/spermidine/putrescine transport system ATPase subunit